MKDLDIKLVRATQVQRKLRSTFLRMHSKNHPMQANLISGHK